jgi:hypothetical protein
VRHRLGRIVITAAMCACAAPAAHAGPALITAAQAFGTSTPHPHTTRPLTLTLPAVAAPADSAHRLGVALESAFVHRAGPDTASPLAPAPTDAALGFPIQWQKRTELERVARNFKHNGLPLVHLWGSGRNLLAIGVSPRGVPGLYFTQKVPD